MMLPFSMQVARDGAQKRFDASVTKPFDQVLKWPSDEDLNGAAVALMRLQDTYQVEPQDLADGVLKGFRAGVELTANDCFELGRQNYNNGEQRDRSTVVVKVRMPCGRFGES